MPKDPLDPPRCAKLLAALAAPERGRFVLYSLKPGVLEDAVDAGIPKGALNLGCCRIEMPNCREEE